ncbi:MAG: hypothetical protein FWG42_01175 [Clostridiales bacterium]|nr:hypothetical protein [Clostridiales bacterium]
MIPSSETLTVEFKSDIQKIQDSVILRRRIKLDGTPENVPMYPTELSTRLSSRLGRPLTLNTLLVLNALKDSQGSGIMNLSHRAGVSEATARTVLDSFVENGIACARETTGETTYMICIGSDGTKTGAAG